MEMDRKKFSMLVEERVRDTSVGYIDAVLAICEELNIDNCDVSRLITNIVKNKLEAEAIELNYIKGGNTLPI